MYLASDVPSQNSAQSDSSDNGGKSDKIYNNNATETIDLIVMK